MANFKNSFGLTITSLAALLIVAMADGYVDTNWYDAHATFYGDYKGGETMMGACGYRNVYKQGYGLATAALSTALFNNGYTCGACFEIYCSNDPQWCKPDPIIVTATNFCPPNPALPNDNGGWCNPPLKHFDLTMAMFLKIAEYRAGIVPVRYRRVLCYKQGGVYFQLKGNKYFTLVMVYNVAGAGDVVDVKIKGYYTNWQQMNKNWGQNWQPSMNFVGQSMSFQVTTSDRRTLTFWDVVPGYWKFGQSYARLKGLK